MRTLIFILVLLSAGANARGADFCALTVDIVSPDGSPALMTFARFIAPDGRVVLDKIVEGPTLRICDFGFGEHKLVLWLWKLLTHSPLRLCGSDSTSRFKWDGIGSTSQQNQQLIDSKFPGAGMII